MFGVPEDIEPHERPIYGYWSDADGEHDKSGLEYYGGVAFMLKDDVRDRSTVTFGDSLDSELPGSKLDKLNIVSMEINEGLVGRDNFSYIEAQVHGGASIDDVEEVIISDYAMGKIIKTYNAATDHQGERGEFKGFHSGLLFSGDFKVSVILRPTREEMGAASWASTKKVTLREYLESEKFKKYHAGTEGGDAFIAHLEKKDGGKKDGGKKDDGKKAGSDSRPSWW